MKYMYMYMYNMCCATLYMYIVMCMCMCHLQTYISSSDKAFTAATIEAIGRVACSISEVTETCLHGLMQLLSHKDGKWSSPYILACGSETCLHGLMLLLSHEDGKGSSQYVHVHVHVLASKCKCPVASQRSPRPVCICPMGMVRGHHQTIQLMG